MDTVNNTGQVIGSENYLRENFERGEGGWIAYKIFNSTKVAPIGLAPGGWVIEPGAVLRENVDTDDYDDCSYGINVAESVDWIVDFISVDMCDVNGNVEASVWKVFIPDHAVIVVPFKTDGKIRANEIYLFEIVDRVYYQDYYEDDDFDCDWDDDDGFDDWLNEDDEDDWDEDEPITQD